GVFEVTVQRYLALRNNTLKMFERVSTTAGFCLGERWWNFAFSLDTTRVINPFTDTTGASCGIGLQPNNLLFLFGTAGEITTSVGTGGHTGDVRTCSTPIPRNKHLVPSSQYGMLCCRGKWFY